MQNWQPDIETRHGPKYLAIADAIARDIAARILTTGMRLPPQRLLAEKLGVDLTTVTRAYGEAQRRGLIEGDGRRGSFVRQAPADKPLIHYREPADTGMNAPPDVPGGLLSSAFQQTAARLFSTESLSPFQYQPSGGMTVAREAGADLLRGRGVDCDADTVIVTAGGQNALHAVVSAELRPGDRIGVTPYLYPGFQALARRYGLHLVVVQADEDGMHPDALDRTCAREGLRGIYIVPTNDNPTTVTLTLDRRTAIAAVARKHGLMIIEDDAYGFLPEDPLAPIASVAPECTWLISSLSKILSPGLRVAWLRAPDVARAWALAADMHETAIMAPPLNAAIVADWVRGGTFERIASAVRAESQARQRLVQDALADGHYATCKDGYHLWVPLQPAIDPAHLVETLRPHGLSVIPSDSFAVERATADRALRVSIGGSLSRDRLQRALRLLAALIAPGATRRTSLV